MIQIRPAEAPDATALQRLFERFVEEAQWLPEGARQTRDFAAVSQGERVSVAEGPVGEIVGLISVWEPESFIHTLCVRSDWQGQGIGSRLLDSLEEWLPRPWRLKCVMANQPAIRFYQARGWQAIETGDGDQGPYFLFEK